jgi:hypothetical protein
MLNEGLIVWFNYISLKFKQHSFNYISLTIIFQLYLLILFPRTYALIDSDPDIVISSHIFEVKAIET